MNLPGDEVHDAQWSYGRIILPVRFKRPVSDGKVLQWMFSVGWLMWAEDYGFKVSTAFHNIRETGVR